jgi:hypothetical protein
MQYIVTKQIAVEAEEPEEAVAKSKTEGKVISLSVTPRPQPMMSTSPASPTTAMEKHATR